MDESFQKNDRLLTRAEYVRTQNRGQKLQTKSLLFLIFPNKLGKTRLGIAVSKKIGNSVKRNRIKRVIREVFRRNKQRFIKSSDIVIIPKKMNHEITYQGLLKEIPDPMIGPERCR